MTTFYYCNSVLSLYKDSTLWSYVGFPALCGHIDGCSKCTKIYLKDNAELTNFDNLRRDAIKRFEDEGNKFNFTCTLKLILEPAQFNTFTITSCEVWEKRYCPAK